MYSTPFFSLDICLKNDHFVSDDGDHDDDWGDDCGDDDHGDDWGDDGGDDDAILPFFLSGNAAILLRPSSTSKYIIIIILIIEINNIIF